MFPINEPFRTANANNPNWVFKGDAKLTNQGTGWLELTSGPGVGSAVLNEAFSSSLGIVVNFEYAAYGAGDGFSFMLINGSAAPSLGGNFGGLGYACIRGGGRRVRATRQESPAGTWEWASTSTAASPTRMWGTAPAQERKRRSSRCAGSGSGTSGFRYLTGTAGPGRTVQTGNDTTGVRKVRITILRNPAGQPLLSVESNTGGDTPFEEVIKDLNLATAEGQEALPSTFKLGFASSYGTHKIRDLTVTAPTDLSIIKQATTSVDPGGTVQYKLKVTNNFTNSVDGATVKDVVPSGVTGVTATCTPGTGTEAGATCGTRAGTGNDVRFPVSFSKQDAAATVDIKGTAAESAANSTITNTATVTPPSDRTNAGTGTATATTTVGSLSSDLKLAKSVDTATPLYGGNVVYTVTVTNDGPSTTAAANTLVTDKLPTGMSYVSDDSGGKYDAGSGIWNVGSLAKGQTATIKITARADTTSATDNQVTNAKSDNPDPTPCTPSTLANCGQKVAVTPRSADLKIGKTVSSTTPDYGTDVTYSVTVTNDGPTDTTGVAVTDKLPAGLGYVSDDSATSGTTYNSGTGVWTAGSLAKGASKTLKITARVDTTSAVINAVTSASSALPDPTPCAPASWPNCGPSVEIKPRSANLETTKTVSDATPKFGTNVTYTVTVTNKGPTDTTGVKVTDKLPAGLAYVSSAPSQGTYDSGTGVWTVGSLGNGVAKTLTIIAKVDTARPVTNSVTASSSALPDPTPCDTGTPGNCGTGATITPVAAELSVSKTVDNATPTLGSNVTFTIDVTNNGPSATTGVKVDDKLPADLTYVSYTATQGTYNEATGVWTVGSLGNGVAKTLKLTAKVGSTSASNVVTSVTSDLPNPSPCPTAGCARVDLAVGYADLSVAKSVTDPTPPLGGTTTYVVTITDNGPKDATGVDLTDVLPTGVQYVSDDSGGAYKSGTGKWTVGSLADGASKTLRITVKVTSTTPGANTVQAFGSNDPDPTPCPTACGPAVAVTPKYAHLAVTKSVDDATPALHGTVRFTVKLTNQGPDDVTGAKLTDLLPPGLSYVSSAASAGSYSDVTGLWSGVALASGASATLTITAAAEGLAKVTNTVTNVSASLPDNNPCNTVCASQDVTAQYSDLSDTKTVDKPASDLGSKVVFTITLHNAGNAAAAGATLTDKLPAGLAYDSSTATRGSYDNATGIWAVGTVAVGATETLKITATVDTSQPVDNAVTATGSGLPDPTPCNAANAGFCGTPARVSPVSADLITDKTVDNTTPLLGGQVVFTLTVTNGGPSAATGVKVTDKLPSGLRFVSSSAGTAYDPATGVWDVGTLADGAAKELKIYALADSLTAVQNAITASTASQPDPSACPPDCGTPPAAIDPVYAHLSATKAVDDATPRFGSDVTFTITLTNNGKDGTTGATLRDQLPAGLDFISSDAGTSPDAGVKYEPAGGVWDAGSLAVGQTKTLHIVADVQSKTPVRNVISQIGSDLPDPTACPPACGAGVQIAPVYADLAVTKAAQPPGVKVGQTFQYVITVTDTGNTDTTGVTVTDKLPAQVSYISDDSGGAYSSGSGVWTVGSLAAGQSRTLKITVRGTADFAVNHVSDAHSDLPDPTPCAPAGNSAVTDVYGCPDPVIAPDIYANLTATKTADTTRPVVGSDVKFTIALTNPGRDDAKNARLTDKLPAGLEYVSSHATAGAYHPATGVWQAGAMRVGAVAHLTIVAKVTSLLPEIINRVQDIDSDIPNLNACLPGGCGPHTAVTLHPQPRPRPHTPPQPLPLITGHTPLYVPVIG